MTRELDTIRKSSIQQGDKMRKNKKSVMYDILESLAGSQDTYPEESKVILDGGSLLRRAIWPQHTTYSDFYSTYVTFVQRLCRTTGIIIVFDGYTNAPSTKGMEQNRRAQKLQSTEILFTEDMPITIKQERFLTNGKNKARFIEGLARDMGHAAIVVTHAFADANTLIVLTAIEYSASSSVVVVGSDIDLLISLIQLSEKGSQRQPTESLQARSWKMPR